MEYQQDNANKGGIMSFLKGLWGKKSEVKGELGYFGLGDWWLSTFTEEERKYIEQTYKPMSMGGDNNKPLTEGNILSTSQTAAGLLSGLVGWFKKSPEDLSIARRILAKAEEVSAQPIDSHYVYQAMIQANYPHRNLDPDALDEAIQACRKQISITPQVAREFKREHSVDEANRIFGARLPAHVGYKQLAIILEKEKRYAEVLQLVKQAKAQGWAGDWDERIERIEKKVQK